MRVLAEDRVVIDRVRVVEAAPHRLQAAALHPGDALLQVVVDLLLVVVGVRGRVEAGLGVRVGAADHQVRSLGTEIDPVVDDRHRDLIEAVDRRHARDEEHPIQRDDRREVVAAQPRLLEQLHRPRAGGDEDLRALDDAAVVELDAAAFAAVDAQLLHGGAEAQLSAAVHRFHAADEVALRGLRRIEAAAVGTEDAAGDRLHLQDLVHLGVDVIDARAQSRHLLLDLMRIEELDAHAVRAPLLAERLGLLVCVAELAEEVAALVEADGPIELLAEVREALDRVAGQLHVDRRRPDVAEAAGGERGRAF